MTRRLVFFALFLALAAAPARPAAAATLLGEPKVDRPSNQYDNRWCPAEKFGFDGSFVADGPEARIVLIAGNWSTAINDYRRERIDNVFLVRKSEYDVATHLPTPELIAAYYCIENDGAYFHFNEVAAQDIFFSDQFVAGADPGWDFTNASWLGITSAPNALLVPIDDTGGCLEILDTSSMATTTTTSLGFSGLTAGEEYVVTLWENPIVNVGPDLTVQIYGTEWFSDQTFGWLWNSDDTRAVSWADYDGDGDHDLYTVDSNAANQLFRNDGGFLWEIVGAAGLANTASGRSVAWADADNDGDLDVYVGNSANENVLYVNMGGTFVGNASGPLGDGGRAYGVSWSDYDLDGDVDLYVANLNQANLLLRNNGGLAFEDVTPPGLDDATAAQGCSWADYDNDGDPDLLVVNGGTPNRLFRNDGGGQFSEVTTEQVAATSLDSRGGAWGDIDGDADLDLFLVNYGAPDRLLRNDAGTFADITPPPLGDAGLGVAARFADFENDGDLDLYLAKYGDFNILYRNDGALGWGIQSTGTVEDDGLARGLAWADLESDGDLDFYLGNDDDNRLFRNEQGSTGPWLQIDLVGTVSNRSAIGARVRTVEAGVEQIREVSGGGGGGSFESLTVEFGFSSAGGTGIDLLEVRWPSGIVQTLTDVAIDQRITVIEDDPTPVPQVGVAAGELRLDPPAPNPFAASTRLRFALPRAQEAELRVFDAAGRRVRTLGHGTRSAGEHSVAWDGRDDAGRPVAAGVYFVELRAEDARQTQRIVRLRVR